MPSSAARSEIERKSFVEKPAAILSTHEIGEISVLQMEIPCGLNLEAFARVALKNSRKGRASDESHLGDARARCRSEGGARGRSGQEGRAGGAAYGGHLSCLEARNSY